MDDPCDLGLEAGRWRARLARHTALGLVAAALVLCADAVGADDGERVVVPDQCPGKFCVFGPWVLEEETTLRAAPVDGAPVVAVLPTGEPVTVVTGEVHAIPGRFVVHDARDRYAPGDTLRVVSYVGGGEWLVEFDGRRYPEHLGFSPWGGEPGRRCEVRAHCWGTLQERFDWRWWAQIRSSDGTLGWSRRWAWP